MSAFDFKETPRPPNLGVSFDLPPEEAVKYFQAKGLQPTFAWQDMIGAEHDHAFTVAKMMDVDMLGDVNGALDRALSEGRNLRQFKEELIPTLQARGWWGRKNVIDPMTGQRVNALLGSSARLQTIFRTNLQGAYAVGAWDMIQSQAEDAPYLIYDAVDDHRTRSEHAALDGTVLPVDDPFWRSHYPPNGWNCRCGVNQYSADELAARGLKTTPRPNPGTRQWKNPRTGQTHNVPTDLDPGWDHNPGQARYEKAQALLAEKAAALPPALRPPKGKTWSGDGYAGTQAPATVTREQKAARLAAAKEAEDAAATRQIQEIAEKTKPDPGNWNAQALAQLQKTETWQNSPPSAQLGAVMARAKSLKAKHATQTKLSGYKKNVLAGKPPTAAQKAALDSAPKAMREDFLGKLGTAKANAEAKQYLDSLSDAKAPIMEKAALKKLTDNGSAAGMGAKELADQVKAQAAALQAKSAQKAALAGYKKKAIAGKMPTDKQAAAFKALNEADQNALVAEIDKAKASAAAAAKKAADEAQEAAAKASGGTPPAAATSARLRDTEINVDRLEKTGGQGGSNPGGTYRDRDTGVEWYVKVPDTEDIARNEVLAGKLYETAGVYAPEVKMIQFGGKPAIASRIERARIGTPDELARASGARDNLTVDAWLANWDVVGLGYDNLQLVGGAAFRIDPGGALRYRAQGGQKGAAFGNVVTELDTLLDANMNPQSAQVFSGTTREQLTTGAARVLAIEDDTIRALVREHGPRDAAANAALADRLVARKRDISERFPEARPGATPAPAPERSRLRKEVSEAEASRMEEGRGNGYTLRSDDLHLEDHRLHVWHHTDVGGNPQTRGQARLRGDVLEDLISKASETGPDLYPEGLFQKILEAVKGVASNPTIRAKDQARVQAARAELNRIEKAIERGIQKKTISATEANQYRAQLRDQYGPWLSKLEEAIQDGPGGTTKWEAPGPGLPLANDFSPPTQAAQASAWTQETATFTRSEIERGRLRETGDRTGIFGTRLRRTLDDGTEVLVYNDPDVFAMYGRVEVRTPGTGAAPATRIKTAIEEAAEIDMAPPSPAQAEALYLRQIAHHRYTNMEAYRHIDGQDLTPEARRDALAAQLSRDMDVDDVRSLPDYQPDGRRQAFDQGNVHRYRAGLAGDPEWEKFQTSHRLHHSTYGSIPEDLDRILDAGGQMAPTTDKLRRGIPPGGMSPESDLGTGGGSFFFTRIKTAASAAKTSGFVWKARQIARTDAVSYPSDFFGNVRDASYTERRGSTVEAWKGFARTANNETIFKESLSLFDDLDFIVAGSEAERSQILRILESHGYTEWPDGRSLEKLVKVRR